MYKAYQNGIPPNVYRKIALRDLKVIDEIGRAVAGKKVMDNNMIEALQTW